MISALRLIDKYFGGFLCAILRAFSFKRKFERPKKILIVRLWTLGETILTVPMTEVLHKKYPRAQIDVLTLAGSPKAVYSVFHFVKKIRKLSIKSLPAIILSFRSYDLVIDTEPYFRLSALLTFWLGKMRLGFDHGIRAGLYNFKTKYNDKIHAAENFVGLLKPLKITESIKTLVEFPKNEKARAKVKKFLKENDLWNRKLVIVHAGTAGTATYRAWPWENFSQTIDLIANRIPDAFFLMNGSNGEMDVNDKIKNDSLYTNRIINIAGCFSLTEVWELYRFADLFISNDTGPMHAAAAQKLPTIGLFGPNTPARFGPYPPQRNYAFYYKVEESPCINVHEGSFKKCPCSGACMKLIKPEAVFKKAIEML